VEDISNSVEDISKSLEEDNFKSVEKKKYGVL
jgi:hypothetical protein